MSADRNTMYRDVISMATKNGHQTRTLKKEKMKTRPTLGTVHQTKDGRWRAVINLPTGSDGKRRRKVIYAKTLPAANRKRLEAYQDLLENRDTPEHIKFETWATRWATEIAPENLNPRVLANAQSHLRKHILPVIGRVKLEALGVADILTVDKVAKAGGAAGRTRQAIRSTLSTCLDAAVMYEKMRENPCRKLPRPRAVSAERAPLLPRDAAAVLASAARNNDPLLSLWASFLLLGYRRGELLGLEWERINLADGWVDLSWQIQYVPWAHGERCSCIEVPAAECPQRRHGLTVSEEARELQGARMWVRPKTRASRRLTPLPNILRTMLAEFRREWVPNPHGLVWATERGLPLDGRRVLSQWRAAQERAGVTPVDLHAARHTTGSLLLELGTPVEVITQILGHSEWAATRRYLHVNDVQAREALNGLGALLLPAGGHS